MELRRRGVGGSRILIDDTGVTRTSLWRRTSLAWSDIDDYRLDIRHVQSANGALYLVDLVGAVLMARDARDAMGGVHRLHFGIDLAAGGRRLGFDWRHRGAADAIRMVLGRIAAPLAARADVALAADGRVQLGPLAFTRVALQWGDREPVPREAVEVIELFDSTPITLRVMKRGKVLPYGRAATRAIPNLCAVLGIAGRLGYPVRGLELLDAVR